MTLTYPDFASRAVHVATETHRNDRDLYRLGALIAERVEPETALGLIELISTMEANSNNVTQVTHLSVTVDRLVRGGMDYYTAFTAMFCHPSDHEPYATIGSAYLTERKARLGDDPEQI